MPPSALLAALPFCMHILIEVPASVNFFLNPLQQLQQQPPPSSAPAPASASASASSSSSPAPDRPGPDLWPPLGPTATTVIRQYAVLLLCSSLIAVVFARRAAARGGDSLTRQVAAILSIYHVPTAFRAAARITAGEKAFGGAMGGAGVHLIVHGLCFAVLATLAAFGRARDVRKGKTS